jgi:cytochrome c oxidase assembly protein subunit 15
MALVLTGVLVWLAVTLWRSSCAGRGFKWAAALIVGLLIVQIALGAATVWTTRNPYYATAHVIVGAVLLAVVFTVTWWTHRDSFARIHGTSIAV